MKRINYLVRWSSNAILEVKWRFKRIYRQTKRFIELAPVVWNGDDYDYHFAIELFATQLNRTADLLANDSNRLDGVTQASKIRAATSLLDKVYSEGYHQEVYDILERMYGEPEMRFEPLNDGSDNYSFEDFWWENAVDKDHNDEINELLDAMIKQANEKHKRAEKLVWQYIHHNITNWWD